MVLRKIKALLENWQFCYLFNVMQLYNTLNHKKEEFTPIQKNHVGLYYCGPTVYWTQHIGNLRGATCVDFIVRTFGYLDYSVKYIRNYTDVGHLTSDSDIGIDKMEKAVKRDKLTPQEIAQIYIKIYEDDAKQLNLLEPNVKPKATEHIKEIIDMVQTLLDKNYAYASDRAIYFNVAKFKKYTQLSGQKLDKNIIGAGVGNVTDPKKRDPADFALWFFRAGAHKNVLQYWSSPFDSTLVSNGEGFPGWHIECSAMSKKYLGNTIDVHIGGIEHIPIHHTNEIAQSESANGVKFVNYWLHNEHLFVDNQKMAKSEGTSYSLLEIKEKGFSPLELRYFFLQAHYRSKLNFTWEAMIAARNGLEHLCNKIRELIINKQDEFNITAYNKEFKQKFIEAISDDFNTPRALAATQELLKSNLSDNEKLNTILDFDRVLGLNLKDLLNTKEELPKDIKELIKQRQVEREVKNWEKADELRVIIEERGYVVEDSDGESKVHKVKSP